MQMQIDSIYHAKELTPFRFPRLIDILHSTTEFIV